MAGRLCGSGCCIASHGQYLDVIDRSVGDDKCIWGYQRTHRGPKSFVCNSFGPIPILRNNVPVDVDSNVPLAGFADAVNHRCVTSERIHWSVVTSLKMMD